MIPEIGYCSSLRFGPDGAFVRPPEPSRKLPVLPMTQGKAEFSMEFSRYLPVPAEVQKTLVAEFGGTIGEDED